LGREKAKVQQIGIRRETKEKPRKPYPREKNPENRGERKYEEKRKCENLNSPRKKYQRMESRVKCHQCVKIIPFVVDR